MLLVVAACGDDGGDAAANLPSLDLFKQPIPDAADPADRAGAASNYVQCVHDISNGGWSRDFGPPAPASGPDDALAEFLGFGLFSLPRDGYVAAGTDTGRVLFTYSVADTPKVAVIVTNSPGGSDLETESGWAVETFATCDPSEYDSSADDNLSLQVWTDNRGNRVPTSTVSSLHGAEHCGWESVTYLRLADEYYVGDPSGVFPANLVIPFDQDTVLPADAIDTGFRRQGAELWISTDATVAYLVKDDRVEAWPAFADGNPVFCS